MRAPSRDIMNKLAGATLALYSYDANPDETTVENIMRQGISLTAKFPVIISHAYQAKRRYFDGDSMFLHVPDPERSTAENILHLVRPDGKYTDDEAKLLDRCLILHAEHGGGNNSSFTVRVTSSSGTDTYSAIAAAVSALKGPRHGGANLRVVRQFDEIKQNVSNWKDEEEVADYLRKILDREAGDGSGLIYGMGHAIYTLSDPRAVALKRAARPLAEKLGFGRGNGPDRAGREADACGLQGEKGQRQADVRERGYVFGLCVQNARPAQVAVHPAVRHRAHCRLDGAPPGGGHHGRQDHPSGLQARGEKRWSTSIWRTGKAAGGTGMNRGERRKSRSLFACRYSGVRGSRKGFKSRGFCGIIAASCQIITTGEAMKHVTIYTDGACSGNPGPGGWGAILQYGAHDQGAFRRGAVDDQQPHGAARCDHRARGAFRAVRGRPVFGQQVRGRRDHQGLGEGLARQRVGERGTKNLPKIRSCGDGCSICWTNTRSGSTG